MTEQWKKYEYLFSSANTFATVFSLSEFLALPKNKQVITMMGEKNYDDIQIKECGEPLIPLATLLKQNGSAIVLAAGEAAYGAQNIETHGLRASVAERLLKAEKILQTMNPTLTFKITDSFRPISLQKQYFDEIYKRYSDLGLTGDELYTSVTKVIADPACHPPHSTGGAIDMTVCNISTGEVVDMGSILDDVDDGCAMTFCPEISDEAKKNRLLLYTAMVEAGFTNAPSEWWHYSYGDREWAIRTGQKHAVYDSYQA